MDVNLIGLIVKNKNIIIGKNRLFSNNTFTMLKAIVKGIIPNDYKLTDEQIKIILDAFIISNNKFNKETSNIILENRECILSSVKIDINSINFINSIDDDLKDFIVEEAVKQEYILTEESPVFLKQNYDVAFNSMCLNVSSSNYIIWDFFSDEEKKLLIDNAIEHGYVLSNKSSTYLTHNKDIVLNSIKKDIDTMKYAKIAINENTDVFKHLLLNGYEFDSEELKNQSVLHLRDKEVMDFYFKSFGVTDDEILKKFANDILNSTPTINDFKSIFDIVAESDWKIYRQDNINIYENVFNKVCSRLQTSLNFASAISDLYLLKGIEYILGKKYNVFYEAMQEYFKIYHSDNPNKLDELQQSKNIIANLSALYIAKSKEIYKKNQITEYLRCIKPYYEVRKDHPIIDKKIVQIEQKNKFEYLYNNNDKDILDFINKLISKYSSFIPKQKVEKMIKSFIVLKYSDLSDFMSVSPKYYKYIEYKKVLKLINRLNSGYIKIDDKEVSNYKRLIKFNTNKYIYAGITFSSHEIESFNKFIQYEKIFNQIKKEIMSKVKTIKITEGMDKHLFANIADDLPFNDEYFKLNINKLLSEFDYQQFMTNCVNMLNYHNLQSFYSDNLYKYFINNGLMLLFLILSRLDKDSIIVKNFDRCGISSNEVFKMINDLPYIISLVKELKIDISSLNDLMDIYKIQKYANDLQIAVLGKDIIEKLCKNKEYTYYNEENIISMANELVCNMHKRNKSTVPYVEGETENYKYSAYDPLDESILLAGINTDACFKIDGNDNDFLHYCALDKNGIVIKITDHFDNFIARASGFRNGNAVYFNQLRTIYDESGNYYLGDYRYERDDIIDVFKKTCEAIISISQNNSREKDKIDFVFVTQSYSLSTYYPTVSYGVAYTIGENPMDNESEDWENFKTTKNLSESIDCDYFNTDYGGYSIICMASSKALEPDDIKFKDVEALYERKRNKILVTDVVSKEVYKKINKISAINSYICEDEYIPIDIPNDSIVITGDNWFIILNNNEIINSCLLQEDKKAKEEFEMILDIIKSNKFNTNHTKNSYDLDDFVKILKPSKK